METQPNIGLVKIRVGDKKQGQVLMPNTKDMIWRIGNIFFSRISNCTKGSEKNIQKQEE